VVNVARNRITWITIAMVVACYACLAWNRRWIADDGLIVVRTVRQLLHGNGPVFNAFERAEASTSTIWTYLVAFATFVSRQDPDAVAVYIGMALAVVAVVIACDATRRWQRTYRPIAPLLPAGVLVAIGVVPFWDFASSGLETGLCFAYVAISWWLLVDVERRTLTAMIVFGLGPLVRPDFAVVAVVFSLATWLIVRPPWRRTLALLGAGIALPLTYEVFRAGYYGTLVPLPALAKSAGAAVWDRGLAYALDYQRPYRLWIPLVLLAPMVCALPRDRIRPAAPAVAAVLLALFVVRVGGDFMHARLLLAPTLLLVMPIAVVPMTRLTTPLIAALIIWAAVIAAYRGTVRQNASTKNIVDERAAYVRWTKRSNPLDGRAFFDADRPGSTMAVDVLKSGEKVLVSEGGARFVTHSAYHSVPLIFVAGRLGTGGVITPLDGIVVDILGLANPLGARITVNDPGRAGHEKSLPWAWIRAEYTDPAFDDDGDDGAAIRAARHALTCGEIAELIESVREPMSATRFWKNLVGSVRRTRLVIPANPIDAERMFCR
jgi:arabinofuranosyltransferase